MITIKHEKTICRFFLLLAVFSALACASSHPPQANDSAYALQMLNARIDSLSRLVAQMDTLLRTLQPDTLKANTLSVFPAQASADSAKPEQISADSTLMALPVQETAPVSQRRQCQAITKSGKRCTRLAKPGRPYCWQHDH